MDYPPPNEGELFVTVHGIFRAPRHDYEKHGYPQYWKPSETERVLFERTEELEERLEKIERHLWPENED